MKFRPYLIRMSLSLLCIFGLVGYFGYSLKDIFLTNLYLNALIVGLTLVGVGYAFYQLIRLKKDWEILEDLKQGQWSFSALPKSHFLDPILSFTSNKDSAADILVTRGLSDNLADRLESERVFPRYLIGLLVFLGLLGTFWGLSQTIAAIADLVRTIPTGSHGSIDVLRILKESLHSPLSGMGTAFSSSLFGLGGSLFVGFLELQVGHAYGRFLNEVESHFTTQSFMNTEKLSSSPAPWSFLKALMTRNVESVDALIQSLEKVEKNEKKKEAVLDKISDSLIAMNEQNKTLQNIMIKLSEGQVDLQKAVTSFPSGLDEESRKSLYNIEMALAHSLQSQKEDREEFIKRLRDEMRIIAKTIGSVSDGQDLLAS